MAILYKLDKHSAGQRHSSANQMITSAKVLTTA